MLVVRVDEVAGAIVVVIL